MVKSELVEVLQDIAEGDLSSTSNIYDHPCSVAIRALGKCYDDIDILRRHSKRHSSQSKKVQMLIAMSYDPSW